MKELDLLLCRYLDRDYTAASAAEQTAFAALLNYPDPELLALLLGQASPADQPTADVLERIRAPD